MLVAGETEGRGGGLGSRGMANMRVDSGKILGLFLLGGVSLYIFSNSGDFPLLKLGGGEGGG